MPIALYRGLSDHDLIAMVAYLRAVPPVQHAVTERSTYPFPLTADGPPVAGVPDPPKDDPVARGAYLAGPWRIAWIATRRRYRANVGTGRA